MILTVRLILEDRREYTQAVEGSTLAPVKAVQAASRAADIPLRLVQNAVVNDGRGFVCAIPVHELNNFLDWSKDAN